MAAAAQQFYNEVWTLLGVGTFVTLLRTVARVRKVGFSKLQADDVLVLIALVSCHIILTYIALIYSIMKSLSINH